MFRKMICILWATVLLAMIGHANAVEYERELSAQACALVEAESGQVLWSRNGAEPLPMASTTKIMTAMLAVEQGDLERQVVIPSQAQGVEGSSIGLQAGETMTMKQLLQGLMMESGNDAAVAVAILVDGSVEAFVEHMNRRAAELGLIQTSFANPNGLPAEGHRTTAEELGKLAAAAMKLPDFAEIVSTRTAQIPFRNEAGKQRWLTNSNKLLRMCEGADGVKTGFTKAAGRCLVSSAVRDGHRIICVTLNDPNDWEDHMALLDFAFSNLEEMILAEAETVRVQLPVAGEQQNVLAVNAGRAQWVGFPDGEIRQEICAPSFVYAPIRRGQQLGTVRWMRNGEVLAELPLLAAEEILPKAQEITIFAKIRKFFNNILLPIDWKPIII